MFNKFKSNSNYQRHRNKSRIPSGKDKWWYSTPLIVFLAAFTVFVVPLLIAIVLLIFQLIQRRRFNIFFKESKLMSISIEEKENLLTGLESSIEKKESLLKDKEKLENILRKEFEKSVEDEREQIIKEAEEALKDVVDKTMQYTEELKELTSEHEKLTKQVNRYKNQARRYKSDVTGLKNFHTRFPHTIDFTNVDGQLKDLRKELDEDTLLATIINLPLHSDNSKELRKLSNATKREIKKVLSKYEGRYTTKANKTIYNLMIIGLQAEIQLLLYQLRYNKIDESVQSVKEIITKYLAICGEGNKSILSTITRFLTEIEPLYIELVQIEYKYYIYREQEKEEQRLIREQMRQEAAERKALAQEKKKLDNEERKFKTEIERNMNLLQEETDTEKIEQLQQRLKELESQMEDIENKREEIVTLTMGKAGYVYIISNLGSFGDDVFKIGMTRRLVPQERVDELGSASVPFKFDVHAMIFSDDAVGLEQTLHKILSKNRVNKVNFRKEFFRTDVDSLKELVEDIDPTAEFVTTMLAEEYKQTVAIEDSVAV